MPTLRGEKSACLAVGWVLLIAARNLQPLPTHPCECGSDSWDFLRIGEVVERSALAFLVVLAGWLD